MAELVKLERPESRDQDAALEARVRETQRETMPVRTPSPSTPQAPASDQTAGKPGSKRRVFAFAALLAGLGAAGFYGYDWWTTGRFFVSTDDAYVRADTSIISAKVAGYVTAVPVTDNATVKEGDLLAQIDVRDYQLTVDAARNKAATQDATIARLKEQAKAQNAVIEQARAQVASAKASAVRAQADFERAQVLTTKDFTSKQAFDQARAERDQTQASVQSAEAAELSAKANLEVLKAQVSEAEHVRAELLSSLDKALLDLSYTTVKAPVAGVIGNKAVQVGQYVQPGTRMLSVVPLTTVYVEANYKETQLKGIKPGQSAKVSVDAAGGESFDGVVESLAPASGSQFSILPPENATGNFTKIVQRVPIRIRVSGDAVGKGYLRPGLSVVTSINTKPETADDKTAEAKTQ